MTTPICIVYVADAIGMSTQEPKEAKSAMRSKIPKPLSPGEEAFALHCRAERLSPQREYRFDPSRKWRFDFAFPDQMIAVEIEGGTWTAGRHTRGVGFAKDCEKNNTAVHYGWRIFRYTTEMVMAGTAINDVLEWVKPEEE